MSTNLSHVHKGFGSVRPYLHGPEELPKFIEQTFLPKGVRHNPIAEHECHVMLIERKTTLHTGTEVIDTTRSLAEQCRPV